MTLAAAANETDARYPENISKERTEGRWRGIGPEIGESKRRERDESQNRGMTTGLM